MVAVKVAAKAEAEAKGAEKVVAAKAAEKAEVAAEGKDAPDNGDENTTAKPLNP